MGPGAGASPHRLWGGRFGAATSSAFEALNNSIGVDFRLWPQDVEVSKAWAMGLYAAGVLTLEECRALEGGLGRVAARLAGGERPQPGDEDVHTMIDRMLSDEAGDVAAKLHTGRSRNDQVATTTRLWSMDASLRLDQAINTLQRTIVSKATEMQSIVMPAYTHMQRAIPVSAAHWLLGHFWPLQRDRVRLRAARTSASVIPLGSGAVAGAAYPIPRVLLQGSLGFDSLSPNSVDAVSDRDFAAELIFSCALLAIHLSRLAEDLIIYGSSEFGFVQFGEAFTSGSSMMPQKRNPDALELARGSAARTLGDLTTLLATLKGLPSSYNKDLQDDKRVLFDAVDTTILVLTGTNGALAEARFNQARMQEAVSAAMMATDLADYLVRKGVAFRDAHGAVGRLVRLAEAEGKDLDSLPIEAFASVHASFGDDIADALSPRHSLNSREVDGGTGPAALRAQVEAAKRALTS